MQGYEIKWKNLGFRFHLANHYTFSPIYPKLTFELLLMISLTITIACVNLSREYTITTIKKKLMTLNLLTFLKSVIDSIIILDSIALIRNIIICNIFLFIDKKFKGTIRLINMIIK